MGLKYSLILLFGCLLYAPNCICAHEVQGSEVLDPLEQTKILKALVLTEQVLRTREWFWRKGHEELDVPSKFPGPLSPQESCLSCSDAAYLFGHLLILQGVPPKFIKLYVINESGGHQFIVYNALTRRPDERVAVFLDPTWVQFENFAASSIETGLSARFSAGAELIKTDLGNAIVSQIHKEGMWIPNTRSFDLWLQAMTVDSQTGKIAPSSDRLSLNSFLALNEINHFKFHKELRIRAEGYAGSNSSKLKKKLELITDSLIRLRVETGTELSPSKYPCGFMFLRVP